MSSKRTRRSERRTSHRANAKLSMRVEGAPDDGRSVQIVTESQNISASGVYCHSDHYLAPLSKVALTIVLPRSLGARTAKELIKCEGIVVRCDSPGKRGDKHYELACMFSSLDTELRERLDQFVTWRNLQALRTAAGKAPTAKRTKVRRSLAGATAVRATRAARGGKKKAAVRRRTVH
jgi:hypothetical protein